MDSLISSADALCEEEHSQEGYIPILSNHLQARKMKVVKSLKPHQHIKIRKEIIADLRMWEEFCIIHQSSADLL